MTLPTMGSDVLGREYLRIAGGYGSLTAGASPAGGLDIDNAGNLATDGDLTVDGELTTQSLNVEGEFTITGRDTTWSQYLHAADGFPTSNLGCSPVAQTQIRLREVEIRSLGFSTGLDQRALFNLCLPLHYSGGELRVELFWTYSAGTAGGDVRWLIQALNLNDGDVMDPGVGLAGGNAADTAIAVHTMHKQSISFVPSNAAATDYFNLVVIRNGTHTNDTFDDSAKLIALRISIP